MGSIIRRLRSVFGGSEPAPHGTDGLTIRAMRHRDLERVSGIEAMSFGSPWRQSSYARALATSPRQFVVAERDGELVGYGGFWVERDKAHIAKVAVHPDFRRRGIACALLESLLDLIRRQGIGCAYLEVRRSNLAAQKLYERFGFHFERVQPRAYPNDGEDALVLARDDLLEVASATTPPAED